MKKLFLLPISLALAAFLLLPLPGQYGAAVQAHRGASAPRSRRASAKEGVLTQDIAALQQPHRRACRVRSAAPSAADDASRTTSTARATSCSRCATSSRWRATAWCAPGPSSGRRRGALAERLVELYKADQPDALTVVLEADGFADLLERTEFLERISDQDAPDPTKVKVLKARAQKAEGLLAELEGRKQAAAETILRRRDDIAAARDRLASAQGELRSERNGRRTVLARCAPATRGTPRRTWPRWSVSRREIRSALAGPPPGGGAPGRSGAARGRLIWPVNGSFTSPFGSALGPAARGHRHRRADRHPDPRRRLRAAWRSRARRRVRQLHLHPARRIDVRPATATSRASA